MTHARFAVAFCVVLTACSSSSSDPVDLSADDGGGNDDGGLKADVPASPSDTDFHVDGASSDSSGDVPTGPVSSTLTATIRDFKVYAAGDPNTDPDFENVPADGTSGPWDDRGIVTDTLGTDGKPVYKSTTKTVTTHGKDAFDKWFRDVASVNVIVHYPIVLTPGTDGSFGYDSEKTGIALSASDPTKNFFPIDDGTPYATPFGNQGSPHNYSFTVELHTTFVYKGGEFFQFRGDDDVFVYIDGKLVIDLGGIHGPETAEVRVDTLGLTKGTDHTLDFFSAERHVTGSNILFTTTLDLKPGAIR